MRDERLDGEIRNRHRRLVSFAKRARASLFTELACEHGGLSDRAKRDVAFVLPAIHDVKRNSDGLGLSCRGVHTLDELELQVCGSDDDATRSCHRSPGRSRIASRWLPRG